MYHFFFSLALYVRRCYFHPYAIFIFVIANKTYSSKKNVFVWQFAFLIQYKAIVHLLIIRSAKVLEIAGVWQASNEENIFRNINIFMVKVLNILVEF